MKMCTRVCRFHKSFYGLKPASQNWYHKFMRFLLSINFCQSKVDHFLFLQDQERCNVPKTLNQKFCFYIK